ncbi:GtrA family protein [Simiduia sp. 21SJ11W-1]|uniref:phosphatase PAP2 family protein n=1 Tax=Simiduia sp. 21SJ11W-1 TaxID=2909669 RepID=UPI0020A12028|nr:phosphatase PAP2 family protein [Simiduia sp. 21SJ11W-1]UTA49054.1 GtrA family protein [Simiduia sp. 21SJ11W-1]
MISQPSPANAFGLLHDATAPGRKPQLENTLIATALVLLAFGAALHSLPEWNQAFFLSVNHAAARQSPDFWAFATVFGDGSIAACLAIGIFIRNPRALAYIFLAAIVAGILIQVPKHVFDAARPPGVLSLDVFSVVGKAHKSNSFPSGHSGSALLAATLLGLASRRLWVTVLLLAVGGLAAYSRMAVGVHWPADVLAGSAIGILVAVLIFRCFADKPVDIPTWGKWVLTFFLGAVSVNGFMHDTGYETFTGVTGLRWVSSGLVAGVVFYWLAVLLWPLAEWLTQKLFRESARQSLTRVFKFGMVGGSGFVVDMSLYALFHSVLGMNLLVARSIAYWLTSTWNWYLNRIFTFKDADNGRKRVQWAKYILMCLISFVPSMGTFYGLTHTMDFFMEHSQLALIAGVLVGALFNYVVAGFLIFKVYGQQDDEVPAPHEPKSE